MTFFDTAQGVRTADERGARRQAVAPFRGDVIIATKFGLVDVNGQPAGRGPYTIKYAGEGSLRRLGVDTIGNRQHSVELF